MIQANYDNISGRLKSIAREGGSIDAAQVKLIGLDEIREAAGDRWPRMRERVRAGSLNILQQHMGPDDVAIPAGDGFLVVLAEGPAGATQRKCQAMRDALLTFYLGEDAFKSLRPEVKNRALSADGLSDLIAASMAIAPDVPRVVARGRSDEIAHVKIFLTQQRRPGPVLVTPVVHERGARRMAYNPDFILDGAHHTQRDFLELDIAILDEAMKLAQAAGPGAVVGATVHASTMQHRRSRETYLSWLAELEPELRRRFFVAVSEIEKGAPLISLAEWCSTLRALTPKVWLDFHYTDHAITSISGSGASGAGFHLPIYTGAQKGPRAERMRDQIKFWRKTLHAQSMRLIINGFSEESFVEEAGALGVDFLTSDTLLPFSFAGARESAN